MSTLEYAVWGLRRGWRVTRTFLFAGAFAAAVVGGVFCDVASDSARKAAVLVLFGLWAAVFGVRARRRFRAEGLPEREAGRADLELGLLLVVATHAAVQLTGGTGSILYPLVFVLVAFLVVYTRQWVGFTLVAATIGLELFLAAVDGTGEAYTQALVHAVFIVFFSLVNLVFTRAEVSRVRQRVDRQIERAKAALADDARDFRLTTPASGAEETGTREEEAARLSRATVDEVRRSLYHHVDLLKRAMGLHTCALLWLDAREETLRVKECVTDAPGLAARPIGRSEGLPGAVLQRGEPVVLHDLRPGHPGIPYYEGAAPVTDLVGVPVMEQGSARGVLCADRADGRPFTEGEVEALSSAVEGILRTVANERVFAQLQRAKSEQSKILRASDALSRALSESEVVDAALCAARQIAPYDLAAVSLVDGKAQVVRRAVGKDSDLLLGVRAAPSSLAASALKTRHYLPHRGDLDARSQIVFDKKSQRVFSRMRSALVLPLVSGDRPLGTLTLATAAASAYREDARTTFQVVTNQLGAALQNARMVRRLEEMATTDGLTGLANHRVFQEEIDRQLASAVRFSKAMSVILCDVDLFKGVNDEYGHPVGDQVLRGFADVLRSDVVRDTDLPARYGGEEFAVVCAGTGTEGAVKLAERIRRDLEAQIFHTEKGDLRVTVSMGVATFPDHARDKKALVERADVALYAAKQGGRNQVRVWEKGMREE